MKILPKINYCYKFHNNGFDAAQITAVWVFEILPEDLEEESDE